MCPSFDNPVTANLPIDIPVFETEKISSYQEDTMDNTTGGLITFAQIHYKGLNSFKYVDNT